MRKDDFLNYLSTQLDIYYQLPATDKTTQSETEHFINGLMTAARFFGVSYSELQAVIPEELKAHVPDVTEKPTVDEHFQSTDLNSPAFERQGKRVIGLYYKSK
jgi:hypothetical protein